MSQPLNDKDVDRIASRVVQRLVLYGMVIFAALFAVPAVFVALQYFIGTVTRGLPSPIAVAITASVIAVPLVALILIWSRRTR